MINLFIDTANKKFTLAIADENKILYFNNEDSDINLSIRLVSNIEKALSTLNLKSSDIDVIYVVDGPGSFTGTRMGVTVAKTWAWALNKKVIPISELELMATTPFDGDYIMPLIDARHSAVFGALYNKDGQAIIKDQYIMLDELLKQLPDKKIIISSYDDFEIEYQVIEPNKNIMFIINKHKNDNGINPHKLSPNYFKKTEAEENLSKEA